MTEQDTNASKDKVVSSEGGAKTDREREAALAAWERGATHAPSREPEPQNPGDSLIARLFHKESWRDPTLQAGDDGYVAPRKRAAYPPSFFAVLVFGLAILALEPTADLGYELLGPSAAYDLGHPGEYHFEGAQDGSLATIAGFASSRRGTYSQYSSQYEVFALVGLPVLVRRAPTPTPPKDSAELYQGRGRLIRLERGSASYFERLLRPSARYSTVRAQFESFGELPLGKPQWILLEDDVPRQNKSVVLWPLVLWAGVIFFAYHGWRSYRLRTVAARTPARR